MLQEMIGMLPDEVTRTPAALAGGIAGAALLLGLFGARYSRTILTLSLVAAGTVIGLHVPKWFGWHIDPMGPAVAAAIVLGLSGYALTQMWEAISLGALLAAVAAAAVCDALGSAWTWPSVDWSGTALDTTLKIYQSIPKNLNKALPAAVALGVAGGWLVVTLWPRLGRVLLYSLAGMMTTVACGTLALKAARPDWVAAVPADPRIQAGAFTVMTLVAAMIQWMAVKGSGNKKASSAKPMGERRLGQVANQN
ncbi:MAG TPA: hypothetical protein VG326_13420 [Tepidisphaeraceae bacterium]|jgi:hypothetical protein|nr:hypothetical protein [Tepidisphaeraceae bacterium]